MPDANESEILERTRILILALEDEQVSVAWNAARDLAKIGPAASAALPSLVKALRTRDANTALWARYAIAKITCDTARHLPVLIEALEDKRLFPAMAATALAGFGPAAAPAVPALICKLSDSDPENRWSAAWALGCIGQTSPTHGGQGAGGWGALGDLLSDSDEKVRWYAAWALSEIGGNAGDATESLIRALDDFDEDVRGYAARALGRIGPAASHAVEKLHSLKSDDNPAVCEEAAIAIRRIRAEE